jgi:hypothetical protein
MSNTPSCIIRISHSSQITLLQLGHEPDAYLVFPHMSHSALVSGMMVHFLLLFYINEIHYLLVTHDSPIHKQANGFA